MTTKKDTFRISNDEIKQAGFKKDFYEDSRGYNGFIKVNLNSKTVNFLNNNVDDKIEEKQRELEYLKKQRKEIEEIQKTLKEKEEKNLSKKEKKKRKKDKKKLKNLPESSRILLGAIEEYKDKFHKDKKDKDSKFDGVTSKSKDGKSNKDDDDDDKKREEKDKKIFEKKFEEPLTLMRQTIIDVDKTLQDIDKLIEETKESRARNRAIMLKDLFSTKSALFNNRSMNARAMGDLQKIRIELELKKQKESGESNEKNKNIALITRAFPQLMNNSGKNKFSDSDKKDNDKKDKKKKKYREDNDEERFLNRASKLIRDEDIELSPHEASIEMEGKYKIAIKKSFKTGDWQFVALDNHGSEIRNFKDKYPGLLPKRKNVDLRFDDEQDIAKDRRTDIIYPVIPVPHLY